MSFRLTYTEILELLADTVLDTATARDIVRRSGMLSGGVAGGSGPITVARTEYLNYSEGTVHQPMGGSQFHLTGALEAPSLIFPNPAAPASFIWIEGISQVRVTAKALVTHASAIIQAGWFHEDFSPDESTGVQRYFPDTGELVYVEPSGEANTNTEVFCALTDTYNASPWIDIHPGWLKKDVFVGLEMRDPDVDSAPVWLGVCEMQVR